MAQGVNGLRNVDIGVPDVAATAKFYSDVWASRPSWSAVARSICAAPAPTTTFWRSISGPKRSCCA